MQRIGLMMAALLVLPSLAGADYILSVRHDGGSSATVAPDTAVTLTLELDSDAGDEHISCFLRVVFSAPGLVYESCTWSSPYLNGTLDDDSVPLVGDLPEVLTDDIVPWTPDEVDIELSNVTEDGGSGPPAAFGEGTLVTLTLRVPGDYSGAGTVTIDADPVIFSLKTGLPGERVDVDTSPGESFILTIPEPTTLALLAVGGLLGPRRRRRRA